jgi:ech hydrogenase subunit D
MDREAFLGRVEVYHKGGWRLALINAASVLANEELPQGAIDVTWAFAKDAEFETIRERFTPGAGEVMPSISAMYWPAFIYENEIRELFGVTVEGINVDLRGQLYQTAERVPFSPSAIRARLEKAGTLPVPGAAHGAKPAVAVTPTLPTLATDPATAPKPAPAAAAPATEAATVSVNAETVR